MQNGPVAAASVFLTTNKKIQSSFECIPWVGKNFVCPDSKALYNPCKAICKNCEVSKAVEGIALYAVINKVAGKVMDPYFDRNKIEKLEEDDELQSKKLLQRYRCVS